MRNIEGIQIKELFVHILDNRNHNLVLSDFPLSFSGNQELEDYFVNHIFISINNDATKAAKFNNININQTSGICNSILKGDINLEEGSKKIAEILYEIIKDQRISPADLAICKFYDLGRPTDLFLAILKIDPSKVFQHTVVKENDKVRIIYKINNEALTKEKLQKCAIIRQLEPRNSDYDMLLLDKQKRTFKKGLISEFFTEKFLDANEALDSTKRTIIFYKTIVNELDKNQKLISHHDYIEINTRLLNSINGKSINVNQWIGNLPVEEHTRELLKTGVKEKISDIEFTTDSQMGGKLSNRVIYHGDFNLRISILSKHFEDVFKSVKQISTPEEGDTNEIVIHTKKWDRD